MSIFNPLTEEELLKDFTHIGWFCFICPVYLGAVETEAPIISERNGVPEWWFDLTIWIHGQIIFIRTMFDPWYVPDFPLLITGELWKN